MWEKEFDKVWENATLGFSNVDKGKIKSFIRAVVKEEKLGLLKEVKAEVIEVDEKEDYPCPQEEVGAVCSHVVRNYMRGELRAKLADLERESE